MPAAPRAAVERFRTTHRAALQSLRVGPVRSAERDGAGVVVDRPACPFVVTAVGDGAVRFVRRRWTSPTIWRPATGTGSGCPSRPEDPTVERGRHNRSATPDASRVADGRPTHE
jgi:hypothetical protein